MSDRKKEVIGTCLCFFLIGLAFSVILAHAGLLSAGRWQGDEYTLSLYARNTGLSGVWERITGWSPRPVAESLSYLYFCVSNAFDRPLIGSFLGCVWLFTLLGVSGAGWIARARQPVGRAMIWFALFLLLDRPGEVFFWPMAAVAYLPLWGGLAVVTMLLLDGRAWTGRTAWVLSGALLVAAFSSEVGAVTVGSFALLVAMMPGSGKRGYLWSMTLLAPVLGSAAVIGILLSHRGVSHHEIMEAGTGLAGSWGRSLLASVPTLGHEVLGIAGVPLILAVLIKLTLPWLVLNDASSDRPAFRGRGLLLCWFVALMCGAAMSVVSAYHQFGILCCERHHTMRSGMFLLTILTLGGLTGCAFRFARQAGLLIVLLLLVAFRAVPFLSDWHVSREVIAARQASWRSGYAQNSGMTLEVGPDGLLLAANTIPRGYWSLQEKGDVPWFASGIMARFGKSSLSVKVGPEP